MRNVNVNVLSAADTASQNGAQIDSNQLISASFHAVFGDATAAGTFKLQVSNDICDAGYLRGAFTVTNWVDLPSATTAIVAGAPAILTVAQMSYRWIRAVYTRSGGGSTTINVNMNALGV